MPVAKIHPPAQLPERGLTEQQFQVWQTQLRAWLYCDEALGHFLPDGRYNQWQAEETNAHRIPALADPDPELPQNPTEAQIEDLLTKRRRQLVVFLSQVANCVSTNHYTTVLRHATSLQ